MMIAVIECLATVTLVAAPVARTAPGGTITYSRLTDGTWQIWRYTLSSGASLQVTFDRRDKRYPMPGVGGLIYYHTSNQEPFSVNPVSGEVLPVLEGLAPLRGATASPDGSKVVFSKIRTDIEDSSNLWMARGDGTSPQTLTLDPGIQDQPAWSPDGRTLAFVNGQGYEKYEICLLSLQDRTITRLTSNTSHEFFPAWSPDGTSIAYSSDATGDYEIWVMDPTGKNARQITKSPGLDSRPSWSPCGNWMAFTSRRSGELEIWRSAPDGSDQQRLFNAGAPACDPLWQ